METIDIRSKSFIVKWIQIPANSTVMFQLKPIKRSIGFSIYKSNSGQELNGGTLDDHNTTSTNTTTTTTTPNAGGLTRRASMYQNNSNNTSSTSLLSRKRSNSNITSSQQNLSLEERLINAKMVKMESYGVIHGGDMFKNSMVVKEGGIYGFVFDNTFSKSNSKKVLFNKFIVDDTVISTRVPDNTSQGNVSTTSLNSMAPSSSKYLQGYLLKKKRKRMQGYTKRYFVLNFKYNTLTYYLNETSPVIRGEMQITISSVTAFENEHTIVIDSGMEMWYLKTLDKQDWVNWINALDYIKMNNNSTNFTKQSLEKPSRQNKINENRKVDKIVELEEDEENHHEYTDELKYIKDKLQAIHFKISGVIDSESNSKLNHLLQHISTLIIDENSNSAANSTIMSSSPLDNNFGVSLSRTTSPLSLNTYYDAEEPLEELEAEIRYKKANLVHVLEGHNSVLDLSVPVQVDELSDDEEEEEVPTTQEPSTIGITSKEQEEGEEEEQQQQDLSPLPISYPVIRRNDISKATCQPPSLFSFLRKNVGKDLTSISMPVTSNEPLTILQKISEVFEYSYLLTEAMKEEDSEIKMLKIAIFALSNLAALRCKERNLRKPFNPILGETFEFVDDVQGFRLIGEKVNHKPQVFAFNVQAKDWECSFTLLPDQKFWGKSIELTNKGVITVVCKKTGQVFKWMQPNTVLKNIIAGERYCEPSTSITVSSSIGLKAVVEFKKPSSSIFTSNRSEELTIKLVKTGSNLSSSNPEHYVEGTWTTSLSLKSNKSSTIINENLWKPTPLPKDGGSKWGFTKFAMNLNEITSIESGKLPQTDSRFRPDVQAYEKGDTEKAEVLKLDIEQIQRDRRKEIEDLGQVHIPRFFKKVESGESWNYEVIRGKEGYWWKRELGNWGEEGFKLW